MCKIYFGGLLALKRAGVVLMFQDESRKTVIKKSLFRRIIKNDLQLTHLHIYRIEALAKVTVL